jgi:hypothetical protein
VAGLQQSVKDFKNSVNGGFGSRYSARRLALAIAAQDALLHRVWECFKSKGMLCIAMQDWKPSVENLRSKVE